ncbi:MAG TPA: hypothetical protein DDZ68_06735 [Parvularcula sp.]|nr:hypothetical protein [Parvularcula sp.]HBS32956.1 hypothetical protein [Parvularcula sp.]
MSSQIATFAIAATASAAAVDFKACGAKRVQIPDFLQIDDARRLTAALNRLARWNVVTTSRGRHLDLDAKGVASFAEADRRKFDVAVQAPATRGFQYLFENYPIYDAYHAGTIPDPEIAAFFEFLNSERMLNFVRTVTAVPEIGFADAQATRFRAGHFLTTHSDGVEGKGRVAAYVLNLTEDWRADWGGILNFTNARGDVERGLTPSFNALNMFAVPQDHHVSYVAPYAGAARLSITGWFRIGTDPMRAPR